MSVIEITNLTKDYEVGFFGKRKVRALDGLSLSIDGGQIFGFPAAMRKKRAADLLARVKLDEKRWDTQLRKFSKGMLQRVGLAQSLINDPEIVFLDEPMSGLDPVGRREVRDLISSLRDDGKTVFMCSHILSDIEVLCDRVAILKRGRLSQVGHLDELRQRTEGPNRMEVLATGADAAALACLPRADVSATPRGLRIEIANED